MTNLKKIIAATALIATVSFPLAANAAQTYQGYTFSEIAYFTQYNISGYADCSGADYYNIGYVDSESVSPYSSNYSGKQPRSGSSFLAADSMVSRYVENGGSDNLGVKYIRHYN